MQQQQGQNMAQAPISTLAVQPTLSNKQQQSSQAHIQVPTFHQLSHQKTFNVVSLLKSTTTTHQLTSQQHQQHHPQSQQQQQLQNQQQSHHQTYNNIINRTVSASTASTQPPAVICQINSTENNSGNVFALNQRHMKNLEQNNTASGNNISVNTVGNGGIVGLNVGCIDNRKYEYKNKLLNNNFQAAQEYNPPNGGNLNAGGAVRANQQQTAPLFRAQAPNSVQRNSGARHLQNNVPIPAIYHQTMPQNMVLSNFPYQARQPFQGQQFAFSQATIPHFYPIPYYHHAPMPQSQPPPPPQHQQQRTTVNNNGSVVNVGNAMSSGIVGSSGVGPNQLTGPSSSNATQQQQQQQAQQVSMTAGAVISNAVPPSCVSNVVLGGVGNSNVANQVGIGVGMSGVPPMVNVVPSLLTQITQTTTKPRPNALPIINPITKKSIFEEEEVSNRSSNTEIEYQDPTTTTTTTTALTIKPDSNVNYQINTMLHQKEELPNLAGVGTSGSGNVIVMTSSTTTEPPLRSNITHSLDPHHTTPIHHHREMIGQTPVVSAMCDAPSVEILPNQPKLRNKKIPIVAPKDDSSNNGSKEIKRDEISSTPSVEEFAAAPPAPPAPATVQHDLVEKKPETISTSTQERTPPPAVAVVVLEAPTKTTTTTTTTTDQIQIQRIEEFQEAAAEVSSENVPLFQAADDSHTEFIKTSIDNKVNDIKEGIETLMASKTADDTEDNCPAKLINSHTHTTINNIEVEKITEQQNNDDDQTLRKKKNSTKSSITSNEAFNPPPPPSSSLKDKDIGTVVTQSNSIHCDETDRASSEIDDAALTEISQLSVKEKHHVDDTSVQSDEFVNIAEIKETMTEATKQEEETSSELLEENHAVNRIESLIQYNEGQWSPHNPNGKKQYDREQLLTLREAKASQVQPEVNNPSIRPQPSLMPPFARTGGGSGGGGGGVRRMQGMVAGSGSHRGGDGSGGNTGYSNKQASMSGVNSRNSTKGVIRVNLSLDQDVKLNETDNAWRPRALNKSDDEKDPDAKSEREKEELLRRIRGILNKLTPEKFDALVDEILELKIDTPDKMEAVMILVFEKAVDEPNFSVSYARLCNRLSNQVKAQDEKIEKGQKSNSLQFRSSLLDKTEREFTQNVTQNALKQAKLQPIINKIKESTDPIEKAELEAQLQEEEMKIRRRSGGTVRFIGELFKINMLTGNIINSCVDKLLTTKSEDMLECLCKLLTTVGAKFEVTPYSSKDPSRCYSLDKVIARMQGIASRTEKDSDKISSRVRFMLQDVIDLRKNNWQSKRNEAPKMMGQIEKETKSEQLSSQYLNYGGSTSTGPSSSSGGGGGGGGGNSLNSQMGGGGTGNKRNDDRGSGRYGDHRSGYSGSHSQRGGDMSLRRQQLGKSSSNNGGNANGGGSGTDDTWHVQTSRGRTQVAVDSIKLEGLISANQDMGNKKMGGMSMFVWNNQSRQVPASSSLSASSTAASNPFAALSSLDDRGSDRDSDRDRDRPRNKGSYNKNSMERDRDHRDRFWNDRSIRSRNDRPSQMSRENSSSRSGPQNNSLRSMNAPTSSTVQKSASHSKYNTQQMSSRITGKPAGIASSELSKNNSNERNHQNAENLRTSQTTTQQQHAPPVFEKPTDADKKVIQSVITEMVEVVTFSDTSENSIKNAASSFERIRNSQKCGFLYYILENYLHVINVGALNRRCLGIIVAHLIENNCLTKDHFKLAYEHFSEIVEELLYDIPDLWLYIFQFTGPLICKEIITVKDLWISQLRDCDSPSMGKKFLKAFLNYSTRGIGVSFTRNMWKKLDLKWTDFMAESDVEDFIKQNKFSYVEDDNTMPYIDVRIDNKDAHIGQVVEHVQHLLNEGANVDSIIDYINSNIVEIEKPFIRSLTTALCNSAITYQDKNYKLDCNFFQKVCVPILQRYIQLTVERELECLYAMQLLVHELEHPRGLLCELFAQVYDADVIPQESFVKWRDSMDQSAGKGVAVKGLHSFFNQLLNSETSDENN